MPNLRAAIKMTPAEVEAFLNERRSMSMATMGRDGSIQVVAMWYGFLDGDVAFETMAKSQKVANLRRDPRMTVLVEDGDTYDQLRGVELVGTAEIVEDPDQLWAIGVSVFSRYQGPVTDESRPLVEAMLRKRVGIRLHTTKTISWDHRKLAGARRG